MIAMFALFFFRRGIGEGGGGGLGGGGRWVDAGGMGGGGACVCDVCV